MIYEDESKETYVVSISLQEPSELTFISPEGREERWRKLHVSIETERTYGPELADWIRDNFSFESDVPTLPGCEITVIEDSAGKEEQ